MPFTVPAVVYMDNLKVYGSSFSAFIHSPFPQEKKKKQSSLEVTVKCKKPLMPIFCLMIEE